ncbi:MAG: FeoA domain [Clostridiaceae bacterium]|nr:FeoA domain [Clostridiaceae bacterium]
MFKSIWKQQVKNKDMTNLENNIVNSNNYIYLYQLECGKSAKVIKLQGNGVLIGKLKNMGIFPGTIILKKSAILAKGPIIVEKGAMQFALGYDIAKKILVERL